jgi:hypothetical protein
MEILAEPRLDWTERSASGAGQAADHPEGILEGEPRVPLAELGPARHLDVPDDPQGRRAARPVARRLDGSRAWAG